DAKRALLRKDIAEFDKTCGDGDPDARTVFQAALQQMETAAISPAVRTDAGGAATQAAVPPQHQQPVGIFGTPGYADRGWGARGAGGADAETGSAGVEIFRRLRLPRPPPPPCRHGIDRATQNAGL